MSVQNGRICPYLIDIKNSQLSGPLAAFESCEATEEGTLKLICSMYELLQKTKLGKNQMRAYSKCWPKLLAAIQEPRPELEHRIPPDGYNRLDATGVEKLLEIHFLASARRLEVILSEAISNAAEDVSKIDFSMVKLAAIDALNDGRLLLAPFQFEFRGSIRDFFDDIFPVAALNTEVERAVNTIAACEDANRARYAASKLIRAQQIALKERLHARLTGEKSTR